MCVCVWPHRSLIRHGIMLLTCVSGTKVTTILSWVLFQVIVLWQCVCDNDSEPLSQGSEREYIKGCGGWCDHTERWSPLTVKFC